MLKLNLNEKFICRIWEDKSNYSDLKTTDGKSVEIINLGKSNSDAGPDYKEAKVKIGDVSYSGSIEIHRSLNDWYLHNHKNDSKYNDVILHVVFYGNNYPEEQNNPVVKKSRSIPTVVLSEYLTKSVHVIWKEVINNPVKSYNLPCYPKNLNFDHSLKADWLSKLSTDRLKHKSARFKMRLQEISDDIRKKIYWEQVLYEFISEALGYSKNKEQFLKLSKQIQLFKIKEMRLERMQADAILFGLSGFLHDLRFRGSYITEIKNHWNELKNMLKKEIMDKSEWNFFRLRPANFPTIRLAYASGLLLEIINKDFLKKIIKVIEQSKNLNRDLEDIFNSVSVSDYWNEHFDFGKHRKSNVKIIGSERIKDIIANVILPFVYFYSVEFEKENLKNRVEYYYKNSKLKSGSNEVTRVMEKQIDFKINSLADEQGLIHLHNFYCIKEKCKECAIGKVVFKEEELNEPLRIILY